MSTYSLPTTYARVCNALPSHTEHSVCVYLVDGANFDAYPSPMLGDFAMVLPNLEANIAIQICNDVYVQQCIDLAPWPSDEVDLDPGYSVRIVNRPQELIESLHYHQAAFIRTDKSLVTWGYNEEATLYHMTEIFSRIQNKFGMPIPTTTPLAGLPGNTLNNGANPDDFILLGNLSLPYLDDFLFLPSFPELLPSVGTDPGLSAYPSWQEPQGSLGLALQSAPSPVSDATSASFADSPMTADLGSVPQSYTPFVFGSEEEETGSNFSFELLSTATSDWGVSPTLSSSQISVPNSPSVSEQQARSSSSFRRHSVAETSAPVIGQKATPYVPQPIIKVNGGDGGNTTTGNADGVDLRTNVRMLKRSRSSHSTIATTGSAPARLTVLPDVEQPYQSRKFLAIAPAPPLASRSPSPTPSASSTSTSTLAPRIRVPAPAYPSSPSPSPSSPLSPPPSPFTPAALPEPAPAGSPRRTVTRRRGGGGGGARTRTAAAGARARRHPCEYCPKTFSRLQDQQRHTSTSCDKSPNRATVPCPECGAILSRLDAAQRHWRGHENPSCAPPEWVSSRY